MTRESPEHAFAELEKYDAQERAETLNLLKRTLNDTRASARANLLLGISRFTILKKNGSWDLPRFRHASLTSYPFYTTYS